MQINPKKDWKVKLERAHFSKVQSGKMTVSSVPDLYVLTVAFLALKNLVFSLFRTPLKKFKFFFYKIISADVSVFKINNKNFLTPIK